MNRWLEVTRCGRGASASKRATQGQKRERRASGSGAQLPSGAKEGGEDGAEGGARVGGSVGPPLRVAAVEELHLRRGAAQQLGQGRDQRGLGGSGNPGGHR